MTEKVNACNMPSSIPEEDKTVMLEIRNILVEGYCGKAQAEHYDGADPRQHKCLGRITFTHDSITMQCPLCGDEKRFL